VSGSALHFERRGHGPAVMLLHGYTGTGRSMGALSRALEFACETLLPDLPGHGRSVAASGLEFVRCLDDLVATLRAAGHERADWVGYSMGARLALGCALRHPAVVRSLVLLAGRAGIEDPDERAARRAADELLAERIESIGVEAFVDEWLAQPMFATLARRGPGFMATERRARLAHEAQGLAASLRALGPGAQPPLFAELPKLQVPVLLVAGALDERFVSIARDLASRLPRAELCVIEDAGHAVHLEQPESVRRVIRDFLRRAQCPAHPDPTHPVQEAAK
jgi:2-succinyl-6-hydroxy-2,4-cyclohexadiene-1-carboxylate synthase